MLGTRGARLGIIAPEIYDVQVEAIVAAAHAVRERHGRTPHVEIMIPLVAYEQEVAILRDARRAGDRPSMGAERPRAPDRHDDRAAAGLLRRRPDRARRRLLLLRHQRPHPDRARLLARRRRVRLPLALPRAAHHRPLAVRDDRRARASAGSSGSPPGSAARHARTSSSGSAASTAAIPTRSPSSTSPAWTTCPARPTACRSPASRRRRPRSGSARATSTPSPPRTPRTPEPDPPDPRPPARVSGCAAP